jgi:hypothetical protein
VEGGRVAWRTQRANPLLPEGASALNTEDVVSLVREFLMDARTIGRTMPRAFNLIFDMASPVTATIIQMGVPEIDRIAVEEGRHLKARWAESRSFWKGLLQAHPFARISYHTHYGGDKYARASGSPMTMSCQPTKDEAA